MKITIEFDTKEELMESQLASALGGLLMNHSGDEKVGPVFTEAYSTPIQTVIPEELIPEDDIPDFKNIDPTVPPYTLKDIRAKVTNVAVILGDGVEKKGITKMLDWIEEMTGGRQISESDTTHYATIGVWMDEVLAGGGDE